MTRSLTRPLVMAACAVLGLALSGCMTLIDPYVRSPKLDESAVKGTLSDAIAAAEAQRSAYYDAVSERAKLRNGLPLALVPLGAAALYKGFTSDGGESTRRLLVKEGLVGASLFGLGSQYTSTAREQIYLSGAKALSCSIYAMTPYLALDTLGADISDDKLLAYARQIARLEAEQRALKALRDAPRADSLFRTEIDRLLAQAGVSLPAARQALAQATATRATLDDAGARMRAVTESLVGEVNLQLSRLEPDPASILALVDSLPATAKRFAPGGTFTPPQSVTVAAGHSTDETVDRMRQFSDDLVQLDQETATTLLAVDQIAQRARIVPPLSSCQVTAVQGQIEVSGESTVPMKVKERRQYVVRSTAGIPSVEWIGTVHPNVEMSKTVAGETLLVSVLYKEATDGIDEVTLEASTRVAKKAFTIALAAAAPASMSTSSAVSSTSDAVTAKSTGDANKRAKGAKKSVAKPDTAANKLDASAEPKQNPLPPATVPGALAPAAAKNDVETGALANGGLRLKMLQAKLGVPATGQFDAATRAAIRKWRVDNGLPPGEELETPVVQGILKP